MPYLLRKQHFNIIPKFLIPAIIILLFTKVTFSQQGFKPCYIIKNKADTIFGTGNVSRNQDYCMFKRFTTNEYIQLLPSEIDAFRIIDGKYYISRQIAGFNEKPKWVFLEFLVDGKIDLFAIAGSGRFFIEKENNELLELNDNASTLKKIGGKDYRIRDNRYIGLIKLFMAETPQLFPEIDKIEDLNQHDLVNLSLEYHEASCKEYECINYAKNVPKVTYKLEIASGVNYHNSYYTPHIGLLVHIWRPLRNQKLYFITGVLYSARNYSRRNFGNTQYNFKIPISMQYVFGKKAFKPTIAFGFPTGIYFISSIQGGFIYSLTRNIEFCLNASVDGPFSFPFGYHKDVFDNNFGHSLNFGILYDFK